MNVPFLSLVNYRVAMMVSILTAIAAEALPADDSTPPKPDPRLLDAIKANNVQLVRRLIDRGVAINTSGQTPLSVASDLGRDDIVSLLLQRGADPNSQDKCGSASIVHATAGSHTKVAKLLLTAGANEQLSDALGVAVRNENIEIARLLILHKVNCNARDHLGTALHTAARYGNVQIVQLLLDAGADATILDDQGRTAAQVAKGKYQFEIRKMIEERKLAATRPTQDSK